MRIVRIQIDQIRLLCRVLRWHNVTCRGKADHDGTEALRWPHH